ncbi:MAG: peptidoglycan-binding protein [Micropruina sp.]|nr:peptidoglycan-binding protein [Micropruina sp.]
MAWRERCWRAVRVAAAGIVTCLLIVGVVPATEAQAAERLCSASTAIADRPLLREGDTGSCVSVAQKLLVILGYLGTSTGFFGPVTATSVRRLQADRGLVVDGIIGRATWTSLESYSIYRGPNRSSRVVLSYDDCPTSLTAFKTVVLAAENLGIGLVLFPTGNCITAGHFDAAYARAHGHFVFNHSISHPNLTTLTYTQMKYQLGSPGVVTNYGRPPFGAYNSTVRKAYTAKNMRMWLWTLDTNDWKGYSRTTVVNNVIANATAGGTVLMHMKWNAFNGTALSQMKAGLAARGLSVCRNYPGTTPKRPVFTC